MCVCLGVYLCVCLSVCLCGKMTVWDFAYFLKAFLSFHLLYQTSPGRIAPDHMVLLKSAQSVCCPLAMKTTIMSPLLFDCLRWMPFPFSFVIVFLTFFGTQLLRTSNPVAEICNDIFFNICVPEICNDIFFNICVPFPFQNKGN